MSATRPKTSSWLTSRLGGWLPVHPHAINRWLKDTIDEAEKRRTSFHPVIEEFRQLIESDPVIYFQFGGSTHCLVFRPGVISEFALQAIPLGENGANSAIVKVNSVLAKASS
jgi:hypothetical protein